MNNDIQARHNSPGDCPPPLPARAKPRFNPNDLPLVRLYRIVRRLSLSRALTYAQMLAVYRTARSLGSLGDFLRSKAMNVDDTDFDTMYGAYVERCALKGVAPWSREKFEKLLLLNRSL
jgi:hypothetical protein